MIEKAKARIETELEVKSYLQDLRYALDHGAEKAFTPEMFPYRKK